MNYILENKHKRYFEAAYAVALASPGVGGKKGNNFRLGAVIVDNKRIVAARYNCLKTHPQLLKYFQWPYYHAEAYAIISLGIDNCADTDLYIVRVLKNNQTALAKPCSNCQNLINEVGIDKVYYTTNDGFKCYENR